MDSDAFFDRIEAHLKQSLPFAVYRKPTEDTILGFLQQNDQRYTITDYRESGFVFAPFDDKEDAVLIPLEHSDQCSCSSVHTTSIKYKYPLQSSDDICAKAFHINLVKKGIEAIEKGDLRKVVLSRKEAHMLKEANPVEIFKRLLETYHSAFVYCFYHPKVGTWLGATPETLLKVDGHRFYTTALAGTQKYNGTLDVIWKQKEIEEQQMVTQYIELHLRPLVKHFGIEPAKTCRAGSLLHLRSDISGTLDVSTIQFIKLLKVLHPTPAVCGVPKNEAKNFILKHESYNREFYTGFLGELNLKEKRSRQSTRHNAEYDAFSTPVAVSNLYVNLRCMKLISNEATLYVGGGITKASNPEQEWQETVNKTQTIKSVL